MDIKLPRLNLVHTRAALKKYHETLPERETYLDNAETDGEVYKWNLMEKAALDEVREAFHEDTKDRNSKDNCMILDLPTLEKWAKEFS
jgi:uncharacterized protein YecA (UPF0149 family)